MNENHNTNNCLHCSNSPCLWSIYQEEVLDEVTGWIHTLLNEEDVPNERKIKKYCYNTFVRLHYGVNSRNIRVNLPRCVKDGIHELVADHNQWDF